MLALTLLVMSCVSEHLSRLYC